MDIRDLTALTAVVVIQELTALQEYRAVAVILACLVGAGLLVYLEQMVNQAIQAYRAKAELQERWAKADGVVIQD